MRGLKIEKTLSRELRHTKLRIHLDLAFIYFGFFDRATGSLAKVAGSAARVA